jgi:hypothetical protein
MRRDALLKRLTDALSSMKLTLACLALLMILVVACTLLQVPLGTYIAVQRTIRTFVVWVTPEGSSFRVPIFPGGGMVGAVLLVNLLFAQFLKLERSRRKAGLWLAHLGLALLFVGEFSTALFQVESQMPIEVGATRDYSEDTRKMELAVVDATDPNEDVVTSIPDSRLTSGAELSDPSLPFKLSVKRYYENSELGMRKTDDPPSEADAGVGANLSVREAPPVTSDDAQNASAALIEPVQDGRGLGTYWVSNALGAPQGFVREGKTWRLILRPRRYYLPFSVTLKEFKHEIYPGTDIPRNFSSLVRLRDASRSEDRDVLIYMNHPLRYGGKTFYQASFGQNDQLSVLQVVRNPGWLIPYLSCAMVALGLLLHFGVKLSASLKAVK